MTPFERYLMASLVRPKQTKEAKRMKTYIFNTETDWYTAQRILGKLGVSYNSFKNEDSYIIEVLS